MGFLLTDMEKAVEEHALGGGDLEVVNVGHPSLRFYCIFKWKHSIEVWLYGSGVHGRSLGLIFKCESHHFIDGN